LKREGKDVEGGRCIRGKMVNWVLMRILTKNMEGAYGTDYE